MALARIIALTLLAASPVLVASGTASAATPQTESTSSAVAIRATVEHEGAKLSATGRSAVGETTKLQASDDEHAHALTVTVVSLEDSGYALRLGYERDGKRIVKAKTVKVPSEEVAVELGGSTITLSVAPAKTKRARIELPDSNDPLAGL